MYDCIIVGGGASGVICAITLAKKNKKVLVIEQAPILAKKLLVTGNGRCNLTNTNMASKFYNQNIDKHLKRFDEKSTLEFFNELGLITYSDEEGRVYPFSNSAKSVVEVLINSVSKLGVEILSNSKVTKIFYNNKYKVCVEDKEYYSNNVVIAIGGGNLIGFENINMPNMNNIMPSLVSLLTESTKNLSGIRISNVEVTAYCNNKIYSEVGEVLFKDSGLSGIVIFNISTLFARERLFDGRVKLNLMPDLKQAEIQKIIVSRLKKFDKLKDIFNGWLVKQVADEIFNKCKINPNIPTKKVDNSLISKLAYTIQNLFYTVKGCYDNNQVFCGGVLLSELTDNLECKKQPGLYYCGEACDVDGICGGYNLQWAWTSGHIVGESI